jgi:hypothetical protein
MPDFGIMRGFNDKLFGDKLVAGQLPTQLGLIGSLNINPLLLNLYPNAAAAYSLRWLNFFYSGFAIRVRRSSDNAEQNIGFNEFGDLDTTSLTSFCSGTNGFVTTWYDQSGNGRNATQTTASNQPQIVSSGSVLNKNGKPAVNFTAANTQRLTATFSQTISAQSSFAVTAVNALTQSYGRVFSQSTNLNDYDANGYIPIIRQLINQTLESYVGSDKAPTAITYGNQLLFASIYTSTQISNKVNNNTTATAAVSALNLSLTQTTIGGMTPTTAGVGYLDGVVQEIVTYYSNQTSNQSGISSNINNYYGMY